MVVEAVKYSSSLFAGYDGYAYSRDRHSFSYRHNLLPDFANALPRIHSTKPRVLDLCAGNGGMTAYFNLTLGFEAIGLDLAEKSLEMVQNMGVRALALPLPFAANVFAGVHFKDALAHIHSLPFFFSEMQRVMIEGGLVLIVYRESNQELPYVKVSGQTKEGHEDVLHYRFNTIDELGDLPYRINDDFAKPEFISPPFFSHTKEEIVSTAKDHGLKLERESRWKPGTDIVDWYPIGDNTRTVLWLRKPKKSKFWSSLLL